MAVQQYVFQWITTQPGITGLAIFGVGFIYAFHGVRFHRALVGLSCAACGWFVGLLMAHGVGLDLLPCAAGCAAGAAFVSTRFEFSALTASAAFVWGVLGMYLTQQFALPQEWALIYGAVAGLLGLMLTILSTRTMTVVTLTMQGVVLMLVGLVGFAATVAPDLCATFRTMSTSFALLAPIVLSVLFATAYSYHIMQVDGETRVAG